MKPLLFTLCLVLVACNDGNTTEPDTSTASDTTSPSDTATDTQVAQDTQTPQDTQAGQDTQPPQDTGAGTDTVSPGCDFSGYVASGGEATLSGEDLDFNAVSALAGTADNLTFFASQEGLAQGTVFTFDDTPLPSCNPCMLMQPNCTDGLCDASFLATGGTATVNSLEGTLELELANITWTEVNIDGDLNSTVVTEGRDYCMSNPTAISLPLSVDPCGDWTEPQLAEVNCGVGNPFTVNFDATYLTSSFERVDSVSWDFDNGNIAFDDLVQTQDYAPGEYRATVEIRGLISGFATTLTTPELIKVIAP